MCAMHVVQRVAVREPRKIAVDKPGVTLHQGTHANT